MTGLVVRDALAADLPVIVAMLAEDQIGGNPDNPAEPLDPAYLSAFAAIDADPNQRLLVAELGGKVVGTMQLSFLPGISNHGAWRGQIEAVRVVRAHRSAGLGAAMIAWAVARCRERECSHAQLTSNATRTDAHRFYERLGWKKSHAGFKLHLKEG
ncbi:MAG: GNAT family N-acetyltransferase [Sphingomonas sp.]|jgi:GNAT superfamily N-acetyltransferase